MSWAHRCIVGRHLGGFTKEPLEAKMRSKKGSRGGKQYTSYFRPASQKKGRKTGGGERIGAASPSSAYFKKGNAGLGIRGEVRKKNQKKSMNQKGKGEV